MPEANRVSWSHFRKHREQPQRACSRTCVRRCGSVPEQEPPRRLQAELTGLSAGAQAPSCGPRSWSGLEHSGAERPSLPAGDSPGACGPVLVGHWTRHRPGWNWGPAEDRCRWAQLGARRLTHTHTHTHTQTHRHTDTHTHKHTDKDAETHTHRRI